ncbi:MAG: dihydroorotate dehydrogenase electron transfer subunit [Deltaproteobacteria bacterium]|nr:dihydroorotate dehydrogenase electron transfer subunit [Deltaproteobacteria bacterium]
MKKTNTKRCLSGAKICSNREIGPGYFQMRIACDEGYRKAVPGQFVMIRLTGQTAPLLRRPFSIHNLVREAGRSIGFDILYKTVGAGTEALSMSRPGDVVDVLGPLGRGFSIRDGFKAVHMVAGGIGIAPFVFLAEHLRRRGMSGSQITLFIGGRSAGDLVCLDRFERLGIRIRITTDDGSAGSRCLVTQPLAESLGGERPDIVFACGPSSMLREVSAICRKEGIACQVSIETLMACGMGACLGCAVESSSPDSPYRHACIDGPVFDAGEIVL